MPSWPSIRWFSFITSKAIQLATALRQGATAFVTNDKQMKKITDLDVLLLDSFL
jgi:predicted nucleic acid-binding protein